MPLQFTPSVSLQNSSRLTLLHSDKFLYLKYSFGKQVKAWEEFKLTLQLTKYEITNLKAFMHLKQNIFQNLCNTFLCNIAEIV